MTERLTGAVLLAIFSLLFVLGASAGEALHFENETVAIEQQDLDEVRVLQRVSSQIDRVKPLRKSKALTDDVSIRLFVVQFHEPVQLWDRRNVETLKASVVSYVPDDALVIRATPKIAHTILLSSPNVRAVLPYRADWKISSQLPLPSIMTEDQTVEATVRFASEKDLAAAMKTIRTLSETEVIEEISAEATLEADATEVRDLATVTAPAPQVNLLTSPSNLTRIAKLGTVVWIAAAAETAEQFDPKAPEMIEVQKYLLEERELLKASPALIEAAYLHSRTDRTSLSKALIVDEVKGLSTGEQHVYPISVNKVGKLVVTLVYKDVEASPVAARPLANDLDVVIVDLNGHETSLEEHNQRFEHLEDDAVAGAYEIHIKGVNVPAGKQPYALLVSIR